MGMSLCVGTTQSRKLMDRLSDHRQQGERVWVCLHTPPANSTRAASIHHPRLRVPSIRQDPHTRHPFARSRRIRRISHDVPFFDPMTFVKEGFSLKEERYGQQTDMSVFGFCGAGSRLR